MRKEIVLGGLALVLVGVFMMFYTLKSSWEILPVYPPVEMPGSSFQNWHLFPDPQKEFQVMFPTLPQHSTNDSDKTQEDIYVAQQPDKSLLMLVKRKYPQSSPVGDLDKTLQDHVTKAVGQASATTEKVNYKGHKAIKFEYTKGDTAARGLAFQRDQTIYTLMRIGHGNDEGKNEFEHFVNTFDDYKEEK